MADKTKKTTGCFLKFGIEIHMKDFLERGEVYCGTMHWFASHKDQKLIETNTKMYLRSGISMVPLTLK